MSQTKVITGEVRFSYAHVFEPSSMNEGETKKYSVALIIPKKDKATVAKIEKAIASALEAGKSKFGGKIPPVWKNPLRDGDLERPDDAVYENAFFINANSTTKPGVVDEDVQAIIDPSEFYSGCYGRASINFYAFNVSGNKGVAAGLNNLQKLKDGDRLSGGPSATDDFGSEDFGSEDDDLL